MRICHLIKGLGRGGAESLLPQTIAARGKGFAYRVGYFLPWKDALVGEVERAGASVHCFETRSNAALLRSIPSVERWLREAGAELVHAHLPLAGVVARLAGHRAGIPVVYTEHNLQERYHWLTRFANRATWARQSHVIAVSGEVAQSIAHRLPPSTPVTVVRNGIFVGESTGSWRAEVRQRWSIDLDAPVVGTVAVFRAQKRLDQWLQAARLLAERDARTRFLLVGDGPKRRELEEITSDAGLSSRVVFAGLQEDVRPYYAAFDVFLTSSQFEGLPLALLEAMAAGLPVVATKVGGIPEVIQEGDQGLLVPFDEPASLAAAVARLLADPPLRERLGRSARERVRREFSVERMASEIETIYGRIAGRTAVAAG